MNVPAPTRRQTSVIWFSLTVLAAAAAAAVAGLLLWGLGRIFTALSSVIWPIGIGVVLAYILDPVVTFFVRRGIARTKAVLLVFGLVVALFAAAAASLLPCVLAEAGDLAQQVPALAHKGNDRLREWVAKGPEAWGSWIPAGVRSWMAHKLGGAQLGSTNTPPAGVVTNQAGAHPGTAPAAAKPAATWFDQLLGSDSLASAEAWLGQAAANAGRWGLAQLARLTGAFGFLAGLAVTPLYVFYLLDGKEAIARRWPDYLPMADSPLKSELVYVVRKVNECLVAFVHGQVLVSFCDGLLYGLGFLVVGVPYALLIGLMAMVVTVIPYVGSFVTTVAALLIAVIEYGDWRHPMLVLGVVAVVQLVEGFVLQPKILGNRVGLHPMVTIIAVMSGVSLIGGPMGAAAAIPIAATLRVLFDYFVGGGRGRRLAALAGEAGEGPPKAAS